MKYCLKSIEILKYWNKKYRNIELLEYRNIEKLEIEILKYSYLNLSINISIFQFQIFQYFYILIFQYLNISISQYFTISIQYKYLNYLLLANCICHVPCAILHFKIDIASRILFSITFCHSPTTTST